MATPTVPRRMTLRDLIANPPVDSGPTTRQTALDGALEPAVLAGLKDLDRAVAGSVTGSANLELVARAFVCAYTAHQGACRRSGEPYILHPLAVATILARMQLDSE